MTRHIESRLQRMCVGWFRLQYPAIGKLLFAVPNGGGRSRTEAAIMKAEGVTAGVTDLILLIGRGGFNALCIEMKTTARESKLTMPQAEWQVLAAQQGSCCITCRTFEEFQTEIRWYMKQPENSTVTVSVQDIICGETTKQIALPSIEEIEQSVQKAKQRKTRTNQLPTNKTEKL